MVCEIDSRTTHTYVRSLFLVIEYSTVCGASLMFPLNLNKYSVTPLYKTITSLLFGTSTLSDPFGVGDYFILGSVERYSDRLLVSQNITNLDIFG